MSGFPSEMHFFKSKVTPLLILFAFSRNVFSDIVSACSFSARIELRIISSELSCRILLRFRRYARVETIDDKPLQGGPLSRIRSGTLFEKNLNI